MKTEKRCFVVGGAVRDVLLGKQPHDIDYVWTGCTSEDFPSPMFSQVGADFPVFLDQNGNEHALARKERKSGIGYKGFAVDFDPSVTLQEDLFRRDLTINAMAVPVEKWDTFAQTQCRALVLDFNNGIQHLDNRVIVPVSEHFKDDPLRVLRAFRFAANLDFNVGLQIFEMALEISSEDFQALSRERFYAELSKVALKSSNVFFQFLSTVEEIIWPDMQPHFKSQMPWDGTLPANITMCETDNVVKLMLASVGQDSSFLSSLFDKFDIKGKIKTRALALHSMVEDFFSTDNDAKWSTQLFDIVKKNQWETREMGKILRVLKTAQVPLDGKVFTRSHSHRTVGIQTAHMLMVDALANWPFDRVKAITPNFGQIPPQEYGNLVKNAVLNEFNQLIQHW